ncbi:hypothetical protein GCM10011371_24080 [Novosphingobium marinum]|uniref:PilZ domain-containing protein n=1 Tax=Novosphingobium marinum TaxID=1514948 RepID=A0A7Y9Y0K5_9SPHN|nr:PilZ domain-containing protein [Novosphingobium marinum]NYH96523.1 hypothetical protein [Novosphingobium marinum]GGC35875.1 hypothetical protein GCM10011371_24080 [Novosphingobium marinum]
MSQGNPRVEDRTRALIKVRLRGAGDERDACILDVSTRGLLVTSARPPERGEFIELVAAGHSLIGQVKWASSRRFGVALRERVSVLGLVAGDKGDITLEQRRRAQRRGPGWGAILAGSGRGLSQLAQTAFIALVAAGAMWIALDATGGGLGVLGTVTEALSGR